MTLVHAGVSTRVLRPIIAGIYAHGLDAHQILAEVGINPDKIADPEARVPHAVAGILWTIAVERTGNPNLGLDLAAAMDLTQFDVQMYAFMNSATLGDGLERTIRYHRLNHDVAQLSIEREGGYVQFRHQLPGNHAVPLVTAQFILGIAVRALRMVAPQLEIIAVCFQHVAPDDTGPYDRHFSCPVKFHCPHNQVVLPPGALDVPLSGANAGLVDVLDRHGTHLLSQLPRVGSLAYRARQVIASQLGGGTPSAAYVAKQLGMSVRTLARRLSEEDTSHKQLVEQLRRELATRCLSDPELDLSDISFLLGFSEPSAFQRAFKRWTGKTPQEFRRAHKFGDAPDNSEDP